MSAFHKNKKNPFFVMRIFFILIISFSCSSNKIRSNGSATFNQGSIIISLENNGKNELLLYNSATIKRLESGSITGSITGVYTTGSFIIFITYNNGLYLLNIKNGHTINIPYNEKAIQSKQIYNIYMIERNSNSLLYITYNSPGGSGVTECKIEKDTLVGIKTYTTANSGLKYNFVHQVISDSKGNLWFRYSPVVSAGVSQLTPTGIWNHYDKYNSNIGDNIVIKIKVEPDKTGFPGNNIWFITKAGLARLNLSAKKEEWFFYGDKKTFINTVTNLVGIEHWFTDAIIDIVDIDFLPQSVLIANKYALYNFSERNIERYIPEYTGGIEELQITDVILRSYSNYVMICPARDKDKTVKYFMFFDIEKKKWNEIKYWNFMRSYANRITISELSESIDFIHFKYHSGESRFAIYDTESGKLTEITLQ